jgi:hypothetical protein
VWPRGFSLLLWLSDGVLLSGSEGVPSPPPLLKRRCCTGGPSSGHQKSGSTRTLDRGR